MRGEAPGGGGAGRVGEIMCSGSEARSPNQRPRPFELLGHDIYVVLRGMIL